MAFSGPPEDRQSIRELMGAYSDAVFRQDENAYLACWSAKGVRVGQGATVIGHEALREQWRGFWQMLANMAFYCEVGAIEVDGDRARARCYFAERS